MLLVESMLYGMLFQGYITKDISDYNEKKIIRSSENKNPAIGKINRYKTYKMSPQCRLFVIWDYIMFQGLDCSSIQAVCEMYVGTSKSNLVFI